MRRTNGIAQTICLTLFLCGCLSEAVLGPAISAGLDNLTGEPVEHAIDHACACEATGGRRAWYFCGPDRKNICCGFCHKDCGPVAQREVAPINPIQPKCKSVVEHIAECGDKKTCPNCGHPCPNWSEP